MDKIEVDMTIVKKIFAKRLKYLRNSKGLSQEELSCFLDVSRNHIASLETSKSGLSLNLLLSSAIFFNCTTDYLLGRSEYPQNNSPKSNDVFDIIRDFNEVKFDDYEISEQEKEKIITAFRHAISIIKLAE